MSLFGNLPPDGELQTSPDVTITFNTSRDPRTLERLLGRSLDAKLSPEPIGPCIAVMASSGPKWRGQVLRVGRWPLHLGEDKEVLASVSDPSFWDGVQCLDLRVQPIGAEIPLACLPTADAPEWTGVAERRTIWTRVGDAMPDKMLTDGKRGLVIRFANGLPVMDWYHTAPRAVFSEIDDLRDREGAFIRTVLVQREGMNTASERQRWYAARPTPFVTVVR